MSTPTETFDVVASGQAERDQFSKIASDNARKLDFLGFGLIALFGGLKQNNYSFPIKLPSHLIWSGLLLTAALSADLLQYVYAAIAFAILARLEEKKDPSARRSLFPRQINWPTNCLFIAKIGLTSAAWVILLIHLANSVT